MPQWMRVRDKSTGHEYDVSPRAFDEELHTRVQASRQYPDLDGPSARPRPVKYRTTKAGQPATTSKES